MTEPAAVLLIVLSAASLEGLRGPIVRARRRRAARRMVRSCAALSEAALSTAEAAQDAARSAREFSDALADLEEARR